MICSSLNPRVPLSSGCFGWDSTQNRSHLRRAHSFASGLAFIIASISFAVRSALFARSAAAKDGLIAVLEAAVEAAIAVATLALPEALADWSPALIDTGTRAASSALFALAGTAAATLFVAWQRSTQALEFGMGGQD